jgi:hypothetical protein
MDRCQKCGARYIELRKNRVSNGSYQVFPWCVVGQHIATKPVRFLPYDECPPLDDISLLNDYAQDAPPCSVPGCHEAGGSENHHYWPQAGPAGRDNDGPQGPLCPKHHAKWHQEHEYG